MNGDPPAITLRLRTIDEEDRPLPGVSILLVEEDEITLLGVSNESGTLDSQVSALEPWRLEARKEGFASSARSVSASAEEVVVRMRQAAPIRGLVHKHNGSGAGPGIRVLALPAGEIWDAAFFSRCARKDPPRHVAITDVSGQYTIEDTLPEGSYTLFAAGNGLLGGPLPGVRAGEDKSYDLVVTVVYGACVEFKTEHGDPVRSPDLAFNEYFEQVDFFSAGTIPLGPWTSSAFLLGLHPGAFDVPSSRLLLFLPKDHGFDGPILGPIYYKTTIPGYRDAQATVWAEPIADGVPAYSLVHDRSSTLVGSVEVRLVETDSARGVLLNQGAGAFATLQLISRNPGGRDFEIELEHLYDGQEMVLGIPHGNYSASVVFQNGSLTWPGPGDESESDIRVADEPAQILVDMRALGSILLDIHWPDGMPYQDSLTVDLGEGEPQLLSNGSIRTSGGNAITFRRGPFLIKGLTPNTYSIKIRRPISAQPDYRPIVVSVSAGETTALTLFMNEEM